MQIRSIAPAFGLAALATAMIQAPTLAADYPVLRGSQIEDAPPPPNMASGAIWQGFYLGGSAGYGSSHIDAYNQYKNLSTEALNALAIKPYAENLIALGKQSSDKNVFGGFAGYNWQFGDAVLGIEGEYQRGKFSSQQTTSRSIIYDNIFGTTVASTATQEPYGTETLINVTAKSANQINDFGVLKARAGYAYGNIMPYVTMGAALAKIRSNGTFGYSYTTVESYDSYQGITAIDPTTGTLTTVRGPYRGRNSFISNSRSATVGGPSSGYVPGLALGAGIDALLGDNILFRADFQRIYFSEYKGVQPIVDVARVGAGLKF